MECRRSRSARSVAGASESERHGAKELFHTTWAAKDMDGRVRRVFSNHGSEVRHAVPSIGEDPEPEVRALTAAADGAPDTTDEPKIQQNNGISGTQSHLNDIVWAKVAVENPTALQSQLFL